jgi:hypothetical protein
VDHGEEPPREPITFGRLTVALAGALFSMGITLVGIGLALGFAGFLVFCAWGFYWLLSELVARM